VKECARVRSEGHVLMTGHDNKSKDVNKNSIFIVREGDGVARGRQWWGSRVRVLVLKVHMEVKI